MGRRRARLPRGVAVLLSGVLIVALVGLPTMPPVRAAGEIVENAGHLSAAVLPNGQPGLLYRNFEEGTSIHFKRYTSETALETSQFISTFQPPYPHLAVFRGRVVAAYLNDDSRLLLSVSDDGGQSWQPEFQPFAERFDHLPRVVTSLDGQLLYVFDVIRGQRPTYRLTASPSFATWSATLPAGDASMRPTFDCFSLTDPDTSACSSAHPYSFQEIRPGIWIYTTASDSGYLHSGRGTQIGTLGGSWTAQVDHGGLPDGTTCCPSDMTPSTFLDRFGNVYFLRVAMEGTNLYYKKSVDGGFTWGDPVFAYDPDVASAMTAARDTGGPVGLFVPAWNKEYVWYSGRAEGETTVRGLPLWTAPATYAQSGTKRLFGSQGGDLGSGDPIGDFGSDKAYAFGAQPQGATSKDPVNLGTGSLTVQANDLSLPGRVLGFGFTRWYNSADPTTGPLGPAWTHTYNWTLADDGATVDLRRGDGRVDTFTRNGDGSYAPPPNVFDTLVKNPDGTFTLTTTNQVRYDLSTGGQLVRIGESAGNQIVLNYTGGNLSSITDTVGRVVALTYDAQSRLTRLQDALGRATTYAYDANGRLATVTDRIGNGTGPATAHQWRYAYDSDTRHITSITDPDGRVRVTNTYDAQGRVVEQRDGLSQLTTIAYGPGQTVITDPRGHATTYTFDSRFRVLSQSDPVGANTYTISYTYDAAGNRTSVTDRNGKRTDFTYNTQGNLLSKTDPSPDGVSPRPVTTFSYDAKNNLTQLTDATGFQTALTYNTATNVLLSVTRQINATTSAKTTYDYADGANPGQPTRIVAPRGNTTGTPNPTFSTSLAYDAQGNLIRLTDADGAITTFGYDAVGRPVSVVDPDGNAPGSVPAQHTWLMSYDELDRETSRTDPLGSVTRYAYDGVGDQTSVTDRNGNVTTSAYDANARLATVRQRPDPLSNPSLVYTTGVTRDANGNTTQVAQANAVSTDYAYDALDRLVSVTTHPTPTTTLITGYTLDGNGQPTSRTTGDGVTVSFTYDNLSRLIAIGGPALATSYAYDAVGRRTRMTDATGVTNYQYDGLGRLTQTAAPNGTLGYLYDRDGNRTRLTYPGNQSVNYTYSPGGRLTQLTDWANRTSTYTYKPSGLVSTLAYPNAMVASYAYDRARRITDLTYRRGTVIASERYTVDPEGNRVALEDLFGTTPRVAGTMHYDGLERLTSFERHLVSNGASVSNETFNLDPASNIASRTGPAATNSYDGANRMTSDGTRTFVWNGADRLTARGSDTFGYDPLGRMTSSLVAGTTRTYRYDGDGLLRSRTQGSSTTSFLYDPSVAPAPLLVAGSERLVYGLGPLYRVHQNGTYDTFVRDGLGTVRVELSGTGQITNAFDYSAYGKLNFATQTPLLGFAGELTDPSGLIYLRARWYDPNVGRFITRDPLEGAPGAPPSLNGFAYGHARPTFFTDPLGLDPSSGAFAPERNLRFLFDFLAGLGATNRHYGQGDVETADMRRSLGVQMMRDVFVQEGCHDQTRLAYDSVQAYWDTVANPATADWTSTAAQVGGFARASIVNSGHGTITVTISNQAGANSFFYHVVPNAPWTRGPLRTIYQTFSWTEAAPLGCQ